MRTIQPRAGVTEQDCNASPQSGVPAHSAAAASIAGQERGTSNNGVNGSLAPKPNRRVANRETLTLPPPSEAEINLEQLLKKYGITDPDFSKEDITAQLLLRRIGITDRDCLDGVFR